MGVIVRIVFYIIKKYPNNITKFINSNVLCLPIAYINVVFMVVPLPPSIADGFLFISRLIVLSVRSSRNGARTNLLDFGMDIEQYFRAIVGVVAINHKRAHHISSREKRPCVA